MSSAGDVSHLGRARGGHATRYRSQGGVPSSSPGAGAAAPLAVPMPAQNQRYVSARPRRSGMVGYRVRQYNKGDDGRLLAEDGLRLRTTDGGRHWKPTQLRRREPGGEWHSLATRPCVWHNPTQRFTATGKPIPTRFGYTCFPRASFAWGGN